MKKLLFIFLIFSQIYIVAQETNVSKRGTTVAQFMNVAQGARATGMGGAFVAVADDATSIFWNPAGIARLEGNHVVFDHTNWIADLKYNYIATSFNTGDIGTFGVSLIMSDYGEMEVTTVEKPEGTGETFAVKDMALSVAWAYNLTKEFSIGFNPKIIYQGIWSMSSYTLAVDLGVLYNTPFEGFTLGMAITNFGQKAKLSGADAVILYDQDETTTGDNGRIPAELYSQAWDLPLGFKLGMSYSNEFDGMHGIILDVDAAHPNDDYEYLNVGTEYSFRKMVFFRAGYKSLFQINSEESFTLGMGFQYNVDGLSNIRFDYSYLNFGRLKDVQKISVGVNF